jgi:hypothetical protein
MILKILMALTMLALMPITAAYQYCDNGQSYENVTINGKVVGVMEDCNAQGVACSPGYGCDPQASQQPFYQVGALLLLIIIAIIVWRKVRV